MCHTRTGCAKAIVTVVVVADVAVAFIINIIVIVVHFRFVSMSFRLKSLTLDIPQKYIWKYYCNCMLIQIRNFMQTQILLLLLSLLFSLVCHGLTLRVSLVETKDTLTCKQSNQNTVSVFCSRSSGSTYECHLQPPRVIE